MKDERRQLTKAELSKITSRRPVVRRVERRSVDQPGKGVDRSVDRQERPGGGGVR